MTFQADKFVYTETANMALLPEDFLAMFRHALKVGSFSDLIVRIGQPVIVRSQGTNYQLSTKSKLTTEDVKNLVTYMYDEGVWGDVRSGIEFVSSYEFTEDADDDRRRSVVRMRVIIAKEQGEYDPKGVAIVMRKIENKIPTLDSLNVKPIIREHAFPRQGLVIVAGETGSGKSTLLAAIMNSILTNHSPDVPDAVVADFSDPPEFMYHQVKKGRNIILQHAVGPRNDVQSFAQGIKNAKRMNTTHILIGESRDKESIEQMYDASNIGNCCYTTFHANSISGVLKGMGQKFESEREKMRVLQIIKNSSLIVIQYLAKMGDNRIPIQEVLPFTREVKAHLLNVPFETIYSEIDNCVEKYGITMRADAKRALDAGEIDEATYRIVLSGCD